MADAPGEAYAALMKHNKFPQEENQKPAGAARLASDSTQGSSNFVPSPDEVARRAYFSYVNQGSQPGRDVQHRLEAEAQLVAERNLTRTHAFHNRN